MKKITLFTVVSLFVAGLLTTSDTRAESHRVLPVSAYASDIPAGMKVSRTYFTATTATEEELLEFRRQLIANGARHVNLFLPDVIACELPPGLDVSALPGFHGVVRSEDAEVGSFLAPGRSSRVSWVKRCYQLAERLNDPRTRRVPRGSPGAGEDGFHDVVVVPTREERRKTDELLRSAGIVAQGDRGASQNSEFFGGDILVQLVLPQNNGQFEPVLESWTEEQVSSCVAGAYAGMLAIQSHFPSMPMDFVFRIFERADTKYEAIKYDMSQDSGWLKDVMYRIDPELPEGAPSLVINAFNVKSREQYGTDFVFTGFAVNSENAPGHMFHGAFYTAYATLGGPYNVTPFPAGRDPNGIGDQLVFSQIFQHETGHVFWALDEYEAYGGVCAEHSGYLWYPNMNKDDYLIPGEDACDEDGPYDCLMRYAARQDIGRPWCKWSQGQIGVIDANGNNVPDLYDSPPIIRFAVAAVETVRTPDITVDLKIISTAVPNKNKSWEEDNRINYAAPLREAKYSMTGVVEHSIPALDGMWDEIQEDARIRLTGFPAGQVISLRFRARNTVNVWSATHIKKIYFAGVMFSHLRADVREDRINFGWEIYDDRFGAAFDVYRIDPGGSMPGRLIAENVQPDGPGSNGYVPFTIVDRDVVPGQPYQYYINARFSLEIDGQVMDYDVQSSVVGRTAMLPITGGIISGSAPNPFRDQTQLSVSVPPTFTEVQVGGPQGGQTKFQQRVPTNVEIAVFDVAGRLVSTLYSDQVFDDVVTVTWDGTKSNSSRVPTGVYFIRAKAGDVTGVRKVLLIR